jgi:hypothetical protein
MNEGRRLPNRDVHMYVTRATSDTDHKSPQYQIKIERQEGEERERERERMRVRETDKETELSFKTKQEVNYIHSSGMPVN